MKILIIDTCGDTGTVALVDSGLETATIAAATLPGRTASERLLPLVRDLVAEHSVSLHSLDAIAVVHGPGSFTGLRVGLSAAKGLCEALMVPLIATSRLAVLAHVVELPLGTRVRVVLDAGRGEFYVGDYCDGLCLREAMLTRDELLAGIPAGRVPAVVTCELAVAESLAELNPQIIAQPTAEAALPLVLRRIQIKDFDDTATIDANYLRRTDAEIFAKPRPKASASSLIAETPLR